MDLNRACFWIQYAVPIITLILVSSRDVQLLELKYTKIACTGYNMQFPFSLLFNLLLWYHACWNICIIVNRTKKEWKAPESVNYEQSWLVYFLMVFCWLGLWGEIYRVHTSGSDCGQSGLIYLFCSLLPVRVIRWGLSNSHFRVVITDNLDWFTFLWLFVG